MKLATVVVEGTTRAAVVEDDGVALLAFADVGDLLRAPGWRAHVEDALPGAPRLGSAGLRFAPVVLDPRKVLCVGHNYRAHIAEVGAEVPAAPTWFPKWADGLLAHGADLVLPAVSHQVDWEAELAVVVDADGGVAGYTVANDVSVRDYQKRTSQWLPGKAFDALTPLGPWMVTADAWEPAGQTIRCLLDGEVVQEGDPSDVVFDAAALLADVATFTRLRAGDVVLTGTPSGVGTARTPQRWLEPGQELVTEITGIGRLVNRVTRSNPSSLDQEETS